MPQRELQAIGQDLGSSAKCCGAAGKARGKLTTRSHTMLAHRRYRDRRNRDVYSFAISWVPLPLDKLSLDDLLRNL